MLQDDPQDEVDTARDGEGSDAAKAGGVPLDAPDLNAFTWSSPNPFGEETAYLLLTPSKAQAGSELSELADYLGLKPLGFGGDMPWVGTDYLCVALRGSFADLWAGEGSWLKVPVSDAWTGNAIGRRYIVLVLGSEVTGEELAPEEISSYLRSNQDVFAGLVKIRLRVTDQ